MATRPIEEMPLPELLRMAKKPKGRAFLRDKLQSMEEWIVHLRMVLGPDEPPPAEADRPLPRPAKHTKKPSEASDSIADQKVSDESIINVSGLAECFLSDTRSPYHKVRFNTRGYYGTLCKRVAGDCGDVALADIKAQTVTGWHEAWSANGKTAMAHSLIGMVRMLFGFGATVLENRECERLSVVLHKMKFKMAEPRTERLTAEQASEFIGKAHELGAHSIALAQAFQFECALRQRDVIGEWVPHSEPGVSDVTHGSDKWLRGLRWSEIDESLILRHVTSKRQKEIEIDLKQAPMVKAELARIGTLPTSGPIIVSERTGKPYRPVAFRRAWRKIADDAGIPNAVKNMDTRAGAIDEETSANSRREKRRS